MAPGGEVTSLAIISSDEVAATGGYFFDCSASPSFGRKSKSVAVTSYSPVKFYIPVASIPVDSIAIKSDVAIVLDGSGGPPLSISLTTSSFFLSSNSLSIRA